MSLSIKAKESAQIQKFRKKLEKQMSKDKNVINDPEKIEQIKNTIHKTFERHSDERLSEKTISKSPAPTENKFVLGLIEKLQTQSKAQEQNPQKTFIAKDLSKS